MRSIDQISLMYLLYVCTNSDRDLLSTAADTHSGKINVTKVPVTLSHACEVVVRGIFYKSTFSFECELSQNAVYVILVCSSIHTPLFTGRYYPIVTLVWGRNDRPSGISMISPILLFAKNPFFWITVAEDHREKKKRVPNPF